jgi:aldehyde:ferredoxin oxidoreductase
MSYGYAGKMARIDLGVGRTDREVIPEAVQRAFIGGSGIGAYLLQRELDFDASPLSRHNLLIFANGPLTGTPVPTSSRYQVVSRSPLTGTYGEADCGGAWGDELKRAGWDGIVIEGRAKEPQYVWIRDDKIELRQAEHLWGLDTYELESAIRRETDERAVVTAIGPAGEAQTLLASIMSDGPHGRAAARGGLGAVMGNKRLKAIVVRGSGRAKVADLEALRASIRALMPSLRDGTRGLRQYGTNNLMVGAELLGDLPIKNWRQGSWPDGADRISGQTLTERYLIDTYGCRGCPIRCGRVTTVRTGAETGQPGGGPEYETAATLGAMLLVDDLEAIILANELCNRYGLDTMSTGASIAFGMEAYERRLLTSADTGGIELRWGDADVMIQVVRAIGEQQGIGILLGQGVRRAAQELGQGSEEFAVHAKGLELPAHDPRAYASLALGYATSSRGACHLEAMSHIFERSVTLPDLGFPEVSDRHGTEGKGRLVAVTQDLMALFDSLKLCKFTLFGGVKPRHMVHWLNYVTGWDQSLEEFMKAGERIFTVKRLINNRLGITSTDDTVSERVLSLKRGSGGSAEHLPDLDRMKEQYYAYRNWDKDGQPSVETIQALNLTELRVVEALQ